MTRAQARGDRVVLSIVCFSHRKLLSPTATRTDIFNCHELVRSTVYKRMIIEQKYV